MYSIYNVLYLYIGDQLPQPPRRRGRARRRHVRDREGRRRLRGAPYYVCVYVYTYIYIYTYIHTYLPTYIHTYIHSYIHTYNIYIYIYTYRCRCLYTISYYIILGAPRGERGLPHGGPPRALQGLRPELQNSQK